MLGFLISIYLIMEWVGHFGLISVSKQKEEPLHQLILTKMGLSY